MIPFDKISEPSTEILTVFNHHDWVGPYFGATDKSRYFSYFENQHGDQWVFVGDKGTETAAIYGGDFDWDGVPVTKETWKLLNATMNKTEARWVESCAMAFWKLEIGDGGGIARN